MRELQFEFTVDQSNNTVYIKREFCGSVAQLWRGWTDSQYLDKWWAPAPFKNVTKTLDLKVGGYWLYCMHGPEGEQFWGKAEFKNIISNTEIQWLDAFCDESGIPVDGFAKSLWNIHFVQKGDVAAVEISIHHDRWEDVEANINMGFKEGFTTALQNLEELLNAE